MKPKFDQHKKVRGMVHEEAALVIQSSNSNSNSKEGSNNSNGGPISVLDTRGSSSPSTSTSSFTTNVNNIHQKWPEEMGIRISESVANLADWSELQPIAAEFCLQHKRFGVGLDDMLSGGSHEQDHDLLRWISGDVDDTSFTLLQIDENAPPIPLNLSPQNPPPFHHPCHPKPPAFDQSHEFLLKKQNQQLSLHQQKSMIAAMAVAKQEPPSPPQKQLICDQLFAAAELMLSGNFSHAQGILARLNHQLPSAMSSCNYNPIQRSGFYFKQALQTQMAFLTPTSNPIPTLSNGMFKMCAYKLLSEVSPIIQFINFTSNQTLLEALGDSDYIHIIDFDIGIGAQWASFIQELPRKNNNGAAAGCSLKITAFASPSTHHPVELGLMHENLSQFAHQIGISFQLEVVNLDSFDPNSFSVSGNDAIAVNFPIWSTSTRLPAIPSLLHFIKQVSPRIVVALDRGNERTDLPFPQYLLQGLQYYEVLLDSIDAANVPPYTANKIEMFLLEPQINNMVTGKLQSPEPMPHWKTLFTTGGYFPVTMSSFAEAQADCVVKRSQARGSRFHVERRHSSLVLCWQNRQLMAVSAWRC
ncbi:unnamed protein product [Lactuca virosa]|uniref:Uncharacterized protein n=1 Tax=Lactuca virosa TaxID=75947 RepID=A0AAU9LQT6_9ASTR|nr:unnamed protein product [Lactuca virosa]